MRESIDTCRRDYTFRLPHAQDNRCSDCRFVHASGEGTAKVPGDCGLLSIVIANVYTSRCPAHSKKQEPGGDG